MTDNVEWAALQARWQQTPVTTIAADALRWGLRWRRIWSRAYLGVEIGAVMLMAVLAFLQWTAGQRAAAMAIAALTAVCAAAVVWARSTSSAGSLSSVVGMMDLSIAGTTRSIRLAMASYAMTGACVVYVSVMYFTNVGAPGARGDAERALLAMGWLAAYAAGTAAYHRYGYLRRRRLIALRALLTEGATSTSRDDAANGGAR